MNPSGPGVVCFQPGTGVWRWEPYTLPSCPTPPPPSASGEEHRVAAAARVRASPDLWPCLTLVPTKPCDETRPQERGFNKHYRFLELRLRDFPEDRLCLAGGLCTEGTRLLPSSSAAPTAATLYLSLTTWKYSTPPGPAPLWFGCQVGTSPRGGGVRLVQKVLPMTSGMLGLSRTGLGPRMSRNPPSLLSAPDGGS